MKDAYTEAKLSDLNMNCSHSHFCLKICQDFFNYVISIAAITYFFSKWLAVCCGGFQVEQCLNKISNGLYLLYI